MIITPRTNIVPLQEKHLTSLLECRNHPSTREHLTNPKIIHPQEQEMWFDGLKGDSSRKYFAIEKTTDCSFIGVLRSDEWDMLNNSVRIGLDIAPSMRRKGYGSECFGSFIDHLFQDLGMHRVWLLVSEQNKPAQALYDKLGFKEEGRQKDALFRGNEYCDYISMSILNDDFYKRKYERNHD